MHTSSGYNLAQNVYCLFEYKAYFLFSRCMYDIGEASELLCACTVPLITINPFSFSPSPSPSPFPYPTPGALECSVGSTVSSGRTSPLATAASCVTDGACFVKVGPGPTHRHTRTHTCIQYRPALVKGYVLCGWCKIVFFFRLSFC